MDQPPFPVPNSTTAFWRWNPDSWDNYQSPGFPSDVDVAIIGAGYTGASLAYHLIEKSNCLSQKLSVVILEARQACSGATGRNGGHLKPDPYSRASSALNTHGKYAADEVASFESRHLQAIADLVKKESIDCDYVLTRATDVCLYDKARTDLKSKYDNLTEAGVLSTGDVFYYPQGTAEGISGIKGAKGCFTHTTGHLWPYRLVMRLLEKALGEGVKLQTHTPVSSVSARPDERGYYTLTTPRGAVRAKKVIYATNGYTSALIPELKNKIVPVKGICSHIVSPKAHPPLLSNSYILRFNDWEYDYLIPRTDGSIIVGGGRRDYYQALNSWFDVCDDSSLIESAAHYFDGYMQRHFHGWEDSEAYTESVWTGIMGYTDDAFPYVGEIPSRQNQFICAGFSGHGMPQAFLSAKAVVDMIAEGKNVEDVDLPRLYRCTQERLRSRKQHVSLTAYDHFKKDRDSGL